MKEKSNYVVKTNRLNTAIQTLSKSELRIVQLAIIDARETGKGLSVETPLRLSATRWAEVFKTSPSNAYKRMKEAEETLFNRRFTYHPNDSSKPIKSRWIQQVQYLESEGAIEIVFTVAVVKNISRIDGAVDFFTSYLIEQTVDLKSVYAIRLYELLVQWLKMGKTPMFELEKFREQLGVGVNEYQTMGNFKLRVLEAGINEINKKTDLKVSYENVKKGRKIIGFTFKVRKKEISKNKEPNNNDKDQDTPDIFHKMTEKQIDFFAKKLAKDYAFGGKYGKVGENEYEFSNRVRAALTNVEKQRKWAEELKRVGYDSK